MIDQRTATQRSVVHATFVLERTYPVAPARVFAAFADPAAKARWFHGPDGAPTEYSLDFRVGGREISRGSVPGGPTYSFNALYQDIVPDQRIVTTYEMHMDGTRISVSVATVEITPQGNSTHLVLTEQGAYLDGLDNPAQREHGTSDLLDSLGVSLQS